MLTKIVPFLQAMLACAVGGAIGLLVAVAADGAEIRKTKKPAGASAPAPAERRDPVTVKLACMRSNGKPDLRTRVEISCPGMVWLEHGETLSVMKRAPVVTPTPGPAVAPE